MAQGSFGSPVFFCFAQKFVHFAGISGIFSDKITNCPLKQPCKWFIIPESTFRDTLPNERIDYNERIQQEEAPQ